MSEETRKAEARGDKTAEVKFRGRTFTVSTEYDEYPVEFMEAVEDGRAVGICRGALGPRQWREVQSMRLNMRDLGELSNAIADAMGFSSAGESEASSA